MNDTIKLRWIINHNVDIGEINNNKIYNKEKPYYAGVQLAMQWLDFHMDLDGVIPFKMIYKPDESISFQFTRQKPFSIITLDVPKELVLLVYENIFNEFVCYNEIFLGNVSVTRKSINYTLEQIVETWEDAIYNIEDNEKDSKFILHDRTIIGMVPYFCTNWINKITYFPDNKEDNDYLVYYLDELITKE